MNIAENLQRILQAKQNIATALRDKGVEVSETDTLDSFATKIQEMSTGGGGAGYGIITEQAEPKIFEGKPDPNYVEYFCIIGALLSKDDNGNWTLWNTNPEETNYWDPKSDTITTPSTQYGEVVAVCVGRGLWAKLGWSGLSATYKWAASNTDAIYNNYHAINIHGNGWESTKHMFDVHSDILTGTIWEQLKNGATDDYDLYLPSKYELLDINNNTCDGIHVDDQENGYSPNTFNKNLGKLLNIVSPAYYWSSS